MTGERGGGAGLAVAVLVLIGAHFLTRPVLVDWPVSPDLLAGGLLLGALRLRAGYAAVLGFALGLLEGAVMVSGTGYLAAVYAVVAYGAVRSWELFFTDARLLVPVYLMVGTWALAVASAAVAGAGPSWGYALLEAPASGLLTALLCAPIYRLLCGPGR